MAIEPDATQPFTLSDFTGVQSLRGSPNMVKLSHCFNSFKFLLSVAGFSRKIRFFAVTVGCHFG